MIVASRANLPRGIFTCVFWTRGFVIAVMGLTAITIAGAQQEAFPRTSTGVKVEDSACQKAGPKGCLELALAAMGGRERLDSIKSLGMDTVRHTLLVEQSYRQAPFITSYEHLKVKVDFVGNRIHRELHESWPESDPGDSESDSVLVAGPAGGVYRAAHDSPCSLSDIDWARQTLSLDPTHLLLTALQSSKLEFEQPEMIRSSLHSVVSFVWQGTPVRIAINPWNHLPDAIETVEQFHDHWYQWGDVKRRIYFENWKLFHGLVYPTNQVEERNGVLWQSSQVFNLDLNVPVDEAEFRMDAKAAELSAQYKGWESPFPSGKGTDLAPGITFYEHSWNSTLVKQDDGIIVLEAPLSGVYTKGLLEEARRKYPGIAIKAVLSTSDSWPHVGGVRQAVAAGLPVYILDLNRPLLDGLVRAPHKLHPDSLAQSPKTPNWKIVSQKLQLGQGPNRMELYPLRGVSTERQYMVYFPEHHLLYVSDTLSLDDKGVLYDPELMREVIQAVEREKLQVNTAFAMHQGPVAWTQIVALVDKARK